MRIAATGSALPEHYYDQETLSEALRGAWNQQHFNPRRLDQIHKNVLVGGRHLALRLEDYPKLDGWGEANRAWIRVAKEVGGRALQQALDGAGLRPDELEALFVVSVTGIAAPSLDALLVNQLQLSPQLKRIPIFGLGCVAGAAGVARVADYLRGFPKHRAALLSVELCSLTLQKQDLSIPNLIASGLFGDGAAAVVMVGEDCPQPGPRVVDTRSIFYKDTEGVMGWDISERGFKIVLSAEVPKVAREFLPGDVDRFLADQGLGREDIHSWICHPGGPKVLQALEDGLELRDGQLHRTWRSLKEVGNLSSTSVLMVLQDALREPPPPGSYGLMIAMGPGFCSEMVLIQW